MKNLKKKLSIILLIFLISITLSALDGGTDSYDGKISSVAEWVAELHVYQSNDYAKASTKIIPYPPNTNTIQLYLLIDLYIIQKNPVTQHIDVKERHIMVDYESDGSIGVGCDSGYYIASALSYHEAYCMGYVDSTSLGVIP